MPNSAQDLINRFRFELIDPVPWTTWSDAEFMQWINSGIGATALIDNSASVVNNSVKLSPGTKQTLPGDALRFGGGTRNMGTDGVTPGRRISTIDVDDLVAERPNFELDPVSQTVRHIFADPIDPRRWGNWPPSDGTNYVELRYPQIPDNITQVCNNSATGTTAGVVIAMTNTAGIVAGMLVQDLTQYFVDAPAQPVFPVVQGTKVVSVVNNTSVTIDTALQWPIQAGDWLSFSSLFPLPDAYEEPVFNFVMAHATNKKSTKGAPLSSEQYWQRFMLLLGVDFEKLKELGIGQPTN